MFTFVSPISIATSSPSLTSVPTSRSRRAFVCTLTSEPRSPQSQPPKHESPISTSSTSSTSSISEKLGVCFTTFACATVLSLIPFGIEHTYFNHAALAASNVVKLPPIDRSDTNRCSPSSSAIGQANAARDKLLDLRECNLRRADLSSYDLSGALFSDADLQGAKLIDAQLSKSYAPNASFRDVDFTNAIVDRVTFDKADLTNAIFANAVLSDSTFDGANLENVDFTDVYVGDFAQKNICKNPTTKGMNPITGAPTRESLGCR